MSYTARIKKWILSYNLRYFQIELFRERFDRRVRVFCEMYPKRLAAQLIILILFLFHLVFRLENLFFFSI